MMNLPPEFTKHKQNLQRNTNLVKRKTNTVFRIIKGNIDDLKIECIVVPIFMEDAPLGFVTLSNEVEGITAKKVINVNLHKLPDIVDYSLLKLCYINILKFANENKISCIAFPCISRNIISFDQEESADTSLNTIRLWLQNPKQEHSIEQIIFNVQTEEELKIYSELLLWYKTKGWLGSVNNQKAQLKIDEIKKELNAKQQ